MTSAIDITTRAADLVRKHYVFPDVAHRIADAMEAPPTADDTDGGSLADALTRRAQSINEDRHLRIRRRRAGDGDGPVDWRTHYALEARANAGGIAGVERPAPSTGLLTVTPYLSPVDLAEPYVRAAFALLDGAQRLVIDLRDGRGGTPETVALICGFLLGEEPVHLQDLVDRDGSARQFWSSPAHDRVPDGVEVHVLTSSRTFSGCEELAYNLQALGRATIVGAPTGGGAHPVKIEALDEELEITIPVERSVNAVTGTNWERVGVRPDVECDPQSALARVLARTD